MKKVIIIFGAMLTVLGLCARAADTVEPQEQQCSALLQAAHESLASPSGEDYVTLYEKAFKTCTPAELPVELVAQYYEGRGDYLGIYGKDYAAAAVAYEEGLDRVTALAGIDDPLRIGLLEDLANAFDVLVGQNLTSSPKEDRDRVRELSREALRVRQVVYGENSPEAAVGWCRLSYVEQETAPGIAEQYARTAVRVSETAKDAEALRDSLSCLRSTLKIQGKALEVAELQDRIAVLSTQIEESDRQSGNERP